MAYKDLTEKERAERGRKLADTLQSRDQEVEDQALSKKAMKARLDTLNAEVARLKTEVRTGKEWVADQGTLDIG